MKTLTLAMLALLVSPAVLAQATQAQPNFATKEGAVPQALVARKIEPEQRAAAREQVVVAVEHERAAPPAPKRRAKPVSKKSEPAKATIVDTMMAPAKVNPVVDAFRVWAERSPFKPTVVGGVMRFPYGDMEPLIVCAENRVCLVELNDDEAVEFIAAGDALNWDISPVAQGKRQIITIKPKFADLDTNLSVATDKRTYSMALKSTKEQYVSRYGFYYTPDSVKNYAGQFKRPDEEAEKARVAAALASAVAAAGPRKSEYQRDFEATIPSAAAPTIEYALSGDYAFRPTRVFSDGSKTFLQMPQNIGSSELPALFILDRRGNMGMPSPRYNVEKKMYSVDFVVEKAVLMLGAGRDAQKVEITQIVVKK